MAPTWPGFALDPSGEDSTSRPDAEGQESRSTGWPLAPPRCRPSRGVSTGNTDSYDAVFRRSRPRTDWLRDMNASALGAGDRLRGLRQALRGPLRQNQLSIPIPTAPKRSGSEPGRTPKRGIPVEGPFGSLRWARVLLAANTGDPTFGKGPGGIDPPGRLVTSDTLGRLRRLRRRHRRAPVPTAHPLNT